MRTWMWFVLAIGCSKAKPVATSVDEVGVTIEIPTGWAKQKAGDAVTLGPRGELGVILRKAPFSIRTIDDAQAMVIVGAKITEQKPLPSGGFYFDFESSGDRWITVVLPSGTGAVGCQIRVDPKHDPAPAIDACLSMRLKT